MHQPYVYYILYTPKQVHWPSILNNICCVLAKIYCIMEYHIYCIPQIGDGICDTVCRI